MVTKRPGSQLFSDFVTASVNDPSSGPWGAEDRGARVSSAVFFSGLMPSVCLFVDLVA